MATEIIKKIRDVLVAFEIRQKGLKNLCAIAFYDAPEILSKLNVSGTSEDYVTNLMGVLSRYGQLASGEHALVRLLKDVQEEVGVDNKARIAVLIEEFEKYLRNHPVDSTSIPPEQPAPMMEIGPNPYRGLEAFREEHAAYFFGREEVIQRLHKKTRQSPFVTVKGASGSGKSSLVFAGLVPRLRKEERWVIADFRPKKLPFNELALCLIPFLYPDDPLKQAKNLKSLVNDLEHGETELLQLVQLIAKTHQGKRLLLIVDQFEELYTTVTPDKALQHRFIDNLINTVQAQGPASECTVLMTMRADFMGKALAYRRFADTLQDRELNVGPMEREELRQAIEQPAALQHVCLEEGLTERILEAVGANPGKLPLVQFTLTELWTRQEAPTPEKPGRLTHAAYETIGGVEQALARYAERVYDDLSPDERQRVQHIFTQLVLPGAGTEDTRRVATCSEIGEENWPLVAKLADARLVVTSTANVPVCEVTSTANVPVCEEFASETLAVQSRETVDVVHEALIRSWQRLGEWIDADREFRAWQERLRSAMHQWQTSNYDDDALLRGALLAEAEHWLQERTLVQEQESQFIEASLELRDREQREREARQQRELELARKAVREEQQRVAIQTRAKKRFRNWLVIAILLAIVAIYGFWQANIQKGEAERQKAKAESQEAKAVHQSRISLIRSLVAYSYKEDAQASRELPVSQEDAQASRERAALLARLAFILNERFKGSDDDDVDKEIDDALRTIFRTSAILEGPGHVATRKELRDLVCQSVRFKKTLTPAELVKFVGENIEEDIEEVIAGNFACSKSELSDKPPLFLRSKPMTTTDMVEALSLNLREDGGWGYPIQYVGNYLEEQGWKLANRFEDQGEGVILDKATGLMWQQSGSLEPLVYEEARKYIEQLNRTKELGGYDDWRLPTVEELLSLVEEKRTEREFFELTGEDFEALRDDIPEDVLKRLQSLKSKRFYAKKDFLDAIKPHIGEEQSDDYTARILDHARDTEARRIDPIFDYRQWWCWSADIYQTKDEGSAESAWHVYFLYGSVYWYNLDNYYYVRAVRS